MQENSKKFDNRKPLRVGITGGIGSGKTTVCKIFEQFGIPVYYADDRAKQIMTEMPHVIVQIENIFGKNAYLEDGSLNRAYIAEIVFADSQKLKVLNSIVHPAVAKDSQTWHESQLNVHYTIKEAALMIESGSYKSLDKLIVVSAPLELRIERVMRRDKITREAVLGRMNKQLPEDEKLAYADFIINNDGQKSLIEQVWQIHQMLINDTLDWA